MEMEKNGIGRNMEMTGWEILDAVICSRLSSVGRYMITV